MTQLIASVMPASPVVAPGLLRRAAMDGADWIELRLDCWPPGADLRPALAATALPVLVACRTPRDGGLFRGSDEQRRELLAAALAAGAAGLDLEYWERWSPEGRPRLLIRSFHAPRGEAAPADLVALRDELLGLGADFAKIVVHADDLADGAALLDLLAGTDQQREPTVAFAMGEAVGASRVLSALLGAPFVYAAGEDGAPTAPGQLSAHALLQRYRLRDLGPATALYGVLGRPASGSVGPWVFNRAFQRLGEDAVYLAFDSDRPEAVVGMLPARRLRGLSVTAPHKGRAAALCHRLDEDARRCGAVNTITFAAGGQRVGANTDVVGVLGALRRAGVAPGGGAAAAVLGGGGAGRAAAVALDRLGFRPHVLVRRPDRLAPDAVQGAAVGPLLADRLRELAPAVVVHATPVADRIVVPGWRPAAGSFVLDMVYRPAETPLLRAARDAGARPIGGLEMYLDQAAWQLAAFLGAPAPPLEADALRPFAPIPEVVP